MADRVHLGPFLDLGFWLWALVGVGLGFATSFVLGIFTVPASVLVALILLTRPRLRASAFGTFVGFGAVFLLIRISSEEARESPAGIRGMLRVATSGGTLVPSC